MKVWYSYHMISYYKQQEQRSEKRRAMIRANAGNHNQCDMRTLEELRAEWAKRPVAKAKAARLAAEKKTK